MKIILLGSMPATGAANLRSRLGTDHEIAVIADPAEVSSRIAEFKNTDVIVGGPLTDEIVANCPRLQLFHVFRGGIDGLGIELLPAHIKVANTFHHEIGVAEFAVAAMLVLTRKIITYDRTLRAGDWAGSVIRGEPPDQTTLAGKKAVIVGLGRIGSEIAIRARAFGMHLVAVSRRPDEPSDLVDQRVGYDRLREVLPTVDYVVASCRLSSDTTGLFDKEVFSLMKESAIFVNVARGQVVNDGALYEAIRDGGIAGAAADVWNQMPANPKDPCFPSPHPLHEHANVLFSPNRSSWTWQMVEDRMRDVAENVNRIAAGESITNDVTTQEL